MVGPRLLMVCVVACALAGCGSEEGTEEPDLSSALKSASKQLDEASGLEVEAQNVDVLALSTPVLVVTEASSASALVADSSAVGTLPNPAAGVPTTTYLVCNNDLVVFMSKDFEAKRTVEHRVCAAKS